MLVGLWNQASDFLSNVFNTVKNRGSTVLTGSHYIGPWNRVDQDYIRAHPPVSASDRAALTHDLEYERIAKLRDTGQISMEEARRRIRDSDKRVMHGFWNGFREHPWGSALGLMGIGSKVLLEDHIGLNPNLFVSQ